MLTTTEYILLAALALLWGVQMFCLFFLYNPKRPSDDLSPVSSEGEESPSTGNENGDTSSASHDTPSSAGEDTSLCTSQDAPSCDSPDTSSSEQERLNVAIIRDDEKIISQKELDPASSGRRETRAEAPSLFTGELMFADYDDEEDTPDTTDSQPATAEAPHAAEATGQAASAAAETLQQANSTHIEEQPLLLDDDEPADVSPYAVSVVLVTSNQDFLLRENLPQLLTQQYPQYEVIVVDDNSSDDTSAILQQLQATNPHLRTTFVPASSRRISHRKLALTLGIKAARYPWLAFTDVDCHPASTQWLSSLMRHAHLADDEGTSADAVIGYTDCAALSGFAAWLRRTLSAVRQLRLLSIATRGHAHMAYGTNLVYRRDIFFTGKGYSAHLDLERGDDDIFVHEHILPSRIRADISPTSTVICTDVSPRHQRQEMLGRIATRRYLHGLMPVLFSVDTLTAFLYAVATLTLIVIAAVMQWWVTLGIAIALWAARYALQWTAIRRASHRLSTDSYGPYMPLIDVARPVNELAMRLRYLFSPKSNYHRKQL